MSQVNNDDTRSPNFQGSAYDFQNRQDQEEAKETFGDPGVKAEPKDPSVGDTRAEKEQREGYEEHRNKEPQTHEYARSMNHGRDVSEDGEKKADDPRNQQVPYAPHDDSGASKESPSAREPEDRHDA